MIRRRTFFKAGAVAAFGSLLPRIGDAAGIGQPAANARLFEVTTTVDMAAPEAGMQLWLPLFQSAGGYQKLVGVRWESDAAVRVTRDPAFGASVLHARWAKGDAPQKIAVVQRVATWDRAIGDASPPVTSAEREFWTRPSATIPTKGIVRDTARRILGDARDPKAQARAIYDWVVATTWRDPQTAGCGTGDIVTMMRDKKFGGKCVDINALMVGLCRAAGIPAREIYGVRLASSARFKSLGRAGDVTGGQHCRAEIFLEEAGWFPVDPADVRKAVLEEKLPVDSPPIVQLANDLCGSWEGNWGGYNSANGIRLAGAPRSPSFPFLMYPCAMSDKNSPNCLDAGKFAYRIASAEVTA